MAKSAFSGVDTGSFATTGSNLFYGTQTINGNLILSSSNIPTNLTGSLGDTNGTIKIDNNSIYYCSSSFVPETHQIIVNSGTTYNTHVSIPKNQPGVPNLYSNGFSITTSGNTTYVLTGVYSAGDNWDCEIDNLSSNYNDGTQTMTLTWLDYEPTNIWTKTDFGFEIGKFATTGSNQFYGNQLISGSVNISSSLVVSSTIVNNGNIEALNSDLIIDGGDIILSGSVYFGSGSIITETDNSTIIKPAGASVGQSLVIRSTNGNMILSSSGFIVGGETLTITLISLQYSAASQESFFYTISGSTAQQLGLGSLTGTFAQASWVNTDNNTGYNNITIPIPSNSTATTLTLEITGSSGGASFTSYGFTNNPFTVTNNGITNSELSHIHLVSGDPSMVDIYLGDDDQYVKIEKNGGDVVIGTNINTNHWIFDTSGSLIVPGNIIGAYNLATTGSNTFIGNQIISGSLNIKPNELSLSIGDNFQGGKLAYILQSGDVGYDPTSIKGIIAASADQSTEAVWGCYYPTITTYATDSAIGTGYQNTQTIITACTQAGIAAKICNDLVEGGYSDWYLPSKDELNILYQNKTIIGGFSENNSSFYWSSTENDSTSAWAERFGDDAQVPPDKYQDLYVRAIRSFSIPKQNPLNIDGNIILSGSLIQQVNYAPFASSSHSGATTLDITKDIHLLDVTGIETNNHWILPDGLYDGQVMRFALKGDGTANPNGIFIWPNHLRNGLGSIRNNESWSPFWDNSGGSARSLATAVYIDGAWNIDNGFYNLD
jgi:hypothetical protein